MEQIALSALFDSVPKKQLVVALSQGKFEAMKVLLLARLTDEEKTGIPLMRKHFTHVEMRTVRQFRLWCLTKAKHGRTKSIKHVVVPIEMP